MRNNLLITMSGGTTTVINATLAGLIRRAQKSRSIDRIYAGVPGLLGVLNEELVDLTDLDSSALRLLRLTPGSGFIGTTRITPISEAEIGRLDQVFEAYGIGYFVNIGGNGTIKQTCRIAEGLDSSRLKVAAAPKTVDNDLGDTEFKDVYFTPGFPSCLQYWMYRLHLLNQDNQGASSHDRVIVAQTFGRKTGFLAGAVRAADPQRRLPMVILLPEDQQPLDKVLGRIDDMVRRHSRALVVVSEGYDLGDLGAQFDLSGQVMYGSSAMTTAQLLVNHCMAQDVQARLFIPAMDQRLDILSSSEFDLGLSSDLGEHIVASFEEGEGHFFASIGCAEGKGTKLHNIPLSEIGDYSRCMPSAWLDRGGFDVSDEYLAYLQTLVKEDRPGISMRNGIPMFMPQVSPLKESRLPAWKSSD